MGRPDALKNKRASSQERGVSPPPVKRRQQSTTTQKAVANFFAPASQKEPDPIVWHVQDESLLVGRYKTPLASQSVQKRRKIAAFDFDSTLITSASGTRFGRGAGDWKWWNGAVPGTLQTLNADGYHAVVILSNQAGISLKQDSKSLKIDQKRLADFKAKVSAVFAQLDVPISIYAATGLDRYRKPRTGMWECVLRDYHKFDDDGSGREVVDLGDCFYVGDAGGREGGLESGRNSSSKDHACSDRDFASNVGIAFKTPDEYFLGEKPRPFERAFDPATYFLPLTSNGTTSDPAGFAKLNPVDVVLLCGSPGSGKSTFFWKQLGPLGYERVNQDILKTCDRCLQVASAFITEGKSVAVDNTNADPDTRAQWIKLARKHEVPIRCVLFSTDAKLCQHNDTVRALGGSLMNPEKRSMLPAMAFVGFAGRYREPMLKEGFQDITGVDFRFDGTEEQAAIWKKYWI